MEFTQNLISGKNIVIAFSKSRVVCAQRNLFEAQLLLSSLKKKEFTAEKWHKFSMYAQT